MATTTNRNRRGRKSHYAGRSALTIAAAARLLAALADGAGDVRSALGRISGRWRLHLSGHGLGLYRLDDVTVAPAADGDVRRIHGCVGGSARPKACAARRAGDN